MSTTLHPAERGRLAITAAELADLLAISERHLWACHASGQLGPRPISIGRSKRWLLDELGDWLAAGAPPRDRWVWPRSTEGERG